MLAPRSWSENHWGAEPRTKELPSPLFVEFRVGSIWELWAEVEDVARAEAEARILDERGFCWRVTDSNSHHWQVTV